MNALAAGKNVFTPPPPPLESHVDKVMSRAVTHATDGRFHGVLQRWVAYLPGTALMTVWREDAAEALAALRAELVRQWVPTLRELMVWHREQQRRVA